MNEKIKELAKQAGGRIRNVCYGHGDYVDEFQLSKSKNIEKFAELIIQECIEQCYAGYDSKEDWDKDVRWAVIDQIKKHFGIE